MGRRAFGVRSLGALVGLVAIASPLSCSSERLGSGTDAGSGPVVGGASGQGGGAAGSAGTAGGDGSLSQWTIPFTDSQPFQIAGSGTSVFYLTDAAQQMLGRLDTESGTVTQWPLATPTTSPGDIQVRPSDGAVFFTRATVGELGQFDPQSQLLQSWPLPVGIPAGMPSGPWSIAFDASGRVIFSATDSTGPLIGRLDTTTGHLDVWTLPDGDLVRVGVAPDGTIVFPTMSPAFGVARLDPTTGVFTAWALVDQPLWGAVVDGSGNVVFLQQSSDFQGLARFTPGTGRLTNWPTTDLFQSDTLGLLSSDVFFTSSYPMALDAIDPTVAGTDTILPQTDTETVVPRTSVLTPTMTTLSGQQGTAVVTRSTPPRETSGAFSSWPLTDVPRMVAAVPGAVYFTGASDSTISRLTVGAL